MVAQQWEIILVAPMVDDSQVDGGQCMVQQCLTCCRPMVDSNCTAMVDKGYASGEVKGNDSCTAIKKHTRYGKKNDKCKQI